VALKALAFDLRKDMVEMLERIAESTVEANGTK
jgi:hypothetical protein